MRPGSTILLPLSPHSLLKAKSFYPHLGKRCNIMHYSYEQFINEADYLRVRPPAFLPYSLPSFPETPVFLFKEKETPKTTANRGWSFKSEYFLNLEFCCALLIVFQPCDCRWQWNKNQITDKLWIDCIRILTIFGKLCGIKIKFKAYTPK